jgi:hypothetical protein
MQSTTPESGYSCTQDYVFKKKITKNSHKLLAIVYGIMLSVQSVADFIKFRLPFPEFCQHQTKDREYLSKQLKNK